MKKIVNFPIEVPEGYYCWYGLEVCDHFDNEGGHATCTLGFSNKGCDVGVLKDPKCAKLLAI